MHVHTAHSGKKSVHRARLNLITVLSRINAQCAEAEAETMSDSSRIVAHPIQLLVPPKAIYL